ncbi:quinon protein alcohol dehydrogenase-like superfamily [Pisolithus albus]|nr:quinon protein alcohol dehydrogenase-like superfamily [Pisolithus albus]
MGSLASIPPSNETTNSVLTGIRAPVFALAVDEYSGDIAIALGSEIHIAQTLQSGKCVTRSIFPPPKDLPLIGEQLDKRVRGRAIAFKDKGNLLVVTYLHHGIVCWDTSSFKQRWQINPIHSHQIIGHAALSSDTMRIALTNLGDGVDIYSLGKSYPDLRIKNRPASEDQNIVMQVSWLFDGEAVISGSSDGVIQIWDTSSGEPLQSLEHKGEEAIAAFEYPSGTVIATGASRATQDVYIKLWQHKIDAPSLFWRVTKSYLWMANLACRDIAHSVLAVQSFILATWGPETMIACFANIKDFRLLVSHMARQAALNGIEYLHQRLQDRDDLRNLEVVEQQTGLVVPSVIYI